MKLPTRSNPGFGLHSYSGRAICSKQRREAFATLTPTMPGDDMRSRLFYLESRVALMKILFPMEAKVVVDLAQVDATPPLTTSSIVMVGNQTVPADLGTIPIEVKEEHVVRLRALLKTVELGKQFFPRCSAVLNKIIDDDDIVELANLDHEIPGRQELRRQRFIEIQNRMIQAFNEDKEESDLPFSSAPPLTTV